MTAVDAGSWTKPLDSTTSISPATSAASRQLDPESAEWLRSLRSAGTVRDDAVARLHALLLRAARYEVGRRRPALPHLRGNELEDIAVEAADDAVLSVLRRLDDFRGLSRFTTWAYKFVIFEVSGKVARHAWRRQPPTPEELAWEHLPDSLASRPGERLEQREQLAALSAAIGGLTDRQREVSVALALNDVPIDVLAIQLDSNRNAIYKNLFDARRNLRASLAAAGHPVMEEDAIR